MRVMKSPRSPEARKGHRRRATQVEGAMREPSAIWDLLLLFALPVLLALVNSDWLWGAPVRDSWIYYGYFKRLPLYLNTHLNSYYSSRLSVVIPGWLAHSLFSPLFAHLALHFVLVWGALGGFYLATRDLLGRRSALFSSVALASHPFFLIALGDNYVDGFGITYTLLALAVLTRAARSASPAWLIAAAGGIGVLIVSANLFYVVFLPFLAAHYLVARGRTPVGALLRASGWSMLGASSVFVAFCLASKGLGGRYLFFLSSTHFAGSLLSRPNPMGLPTGTWLPTAVWLVFPCLVLAGMPLVWWRSRGARTPELLWSQGANLGFAILMVAVQASPIAVVLQYCFYGSLLIPFAFLAFAGQVKGWIDELREEPFRRLLGLTAAAFVASHAVRLGPDFLSGAPAAPIVVCLLAGFGVPAALLASRGRRAAALLVPCLAVSMLLARNSTSADRIWDFFGSDRRNLFLQIAAAEATARRYDAGVGLYYWWNQDDPLNGLYDATAATALSGARILNLSFPDPMSGIAANGAPLAPGMKIAILSRLPTATAVGMAALERAGFETTPLGQESVPGPGSTFRMDVIEIRARRQSNP